MRLIGYSEGYFGFRNDNNIGTFPRSKEISFAEDTLELVISMHCIEVRE